MELIDKSAVVAEIKNLIERAEAERVLHPKTILAAKNYLLIEDYKKLLSIIDTFEVKGVNFDEEFDKYHIGLHNPFNSGSDIYNFAKHFFELGLKAQYSSIGIPNIDDIFEEEGIDPNSKDAKIFKECYYMALEKLKAQK